jgi:hypothetical protein
MRPAAQTFSSGSDGSDGPLTLAPSLGTVVFNPFDTARWGRVLDADGDGVYNFTTINVGVATTLKFSGDVLGSTVTWLATGAVVLDGTLDLAGAGGVETGTLHGRRTVAVPGSGGFSGGAGGDLGSKIQPTPGEGPGGGTGGLTTAPCANGGNTTKVCGRGGTFSGNRYLIPLIGGSGGEGARWDVGNFFSGGAGGGAILIASSTSIAVNATINANGGSGAGSIAGGGSGGAIRLVAPTITGNGTLAVSAGGGYSPATAGWVRLEAFTISSGLNVPSQRTTRGSPVDTASLRPRSAVRIKSIGGVAVAVSPSGSYAFPDVTISSGGAVDVAIEATGIPPGTVVTLYVRPETPEDSVVVNLPPAEATLAGTIDASTATVTFTFPYGFSRGYIRASWSE